MSLLQDVKKIKLLPLLHQERNLFKQMHGEPIIKVGSAPLEDAQYSLLIDLRYRTENVKLFK